MIAFLSALPLLFPTSTEEDGQTSFAKLSEEAQDAIVWAVMAREGDEPPQLSNAVKDEIANWANATTEE